jgi:hypothetical protein
MHYEDDAEGQEKIWDEHDWERFLQEQDRRTSKYMELMDRYMDHPERDAIVARAMGWTHEEEDEDDIEIEVEMESLFEEEGDEDGEGDDFDFESNPLYERTLAYTTWVGELCMSAAKTGHEDHLGIAKLDSSSALACGKLAAALNDADGDEIGMTIAFLKRGLKALNDALEAAGMIRKDGIFPDKICDELVRRTFEIRDAVIQEQGRLRAEFRRRHGAS